MNSTYDFTLKERQKMKIEFFLKDYKLKNFFREIKTKN